MEFEERVGIMDNMGVKSSAYDVVKSYVDKKLGKFTAADVLANCPSIGRTSVFNALKKLVEEGYIEKYGEKQQAYYVKKSTFAW
jgi:predicted transcriptional regulator